MKSLILNTLCAAMLAAGPATGAGAGELDLTMSGFAGDTGRARVVIMRGAAGFAGTEPVAKVISVPIRDGQAVWRGALEPGRYAVIAHHDRNGNDALDRPLFGLPLEPYGYSNGAWTSAGLPPFEAVQFVVGAGTAPQHIHMRTNAFVTLAQIGAGALTLLAGLWGVVVLRRRLRRASAQAI